MYFKYFLCLIIMSTARILKYSHISNELASMSDNTIINITKKHSPEIKWGSIGNIVIGKNTVFFKKIALSKMYNDNKFDTSNLYNLPAFYNYGFGSAGINPWREIMTHIKTTNWVLSGQLDNFPLLYHYRIIKDDIKDFDSGLNDKLMKRFGENENIKKYLKDRYDCEYKVVLFLEYIPTVLYKYLEKNGKSLKDITRQIKKILDFLQSKNILHSDAHFGNYLVDHAGNIYITDFGLVIDKDFVLSTKEKYFMKKNIKLPYYYFYESVFTCYFWQVSKNKQVIKIFEKYDQDDQKTGFIKYIIENINAINKIAKLDDEYLKIIKNNKAKITKTKLLKINFSNADNETKNEIFL